MKNYQRKSKKLIHKHDAIIDFLDIEGQKLHNLSKLNENSQKIMWTSGCRSAVQ